MLWWLWVLLGLALFVVEVMTPGGFYMLFFGVAAMVVGALMGLGLAGPLWAQLFLFSVLSVGSLVLFRGRLLNWFKAHQGPEPRVDSLVGEFAVLHDDLAAGAFGKAELRGTVWTVQNTGERLLSRGERCRVDRVEGLTLYVRAT
jgi:hypothetical protein